MDRWKGDAAPLLDVIVVVVVVVVVVVLLLLDEVAVAEEKTVSAARLEAAEPSEFLRPRGGLPGRDDAYDVTSVSCVAAALLSASFMVCLCLVRGAQKWCSSRSTMPASTSNTSSSLRLLLVLVVVMVVAVAVAVVE